MCLLQVYMLGMDLTINSFQTHGLKFRRGRVETCTRITIANDTQNHQSFSITNDSTKPRTIIMFPSEFELGSMSIINEQ